MKSKLTLYPNRFNLMEKYHERAKPSEREAVMAYFGDDLTDEDAFQALKGKGLAVLVSSHRRVTAADVWIKPPPEELIKLLGLWEGLRSRPRSTV